MIYAINICVPTKSGDRYKIVAINTYPIIIVGEKGCYQEVLSSIQMSDYIKQNVSENLRQQITYKIRQIDGNDIIEIDIPKTKKVTI